MDGSETFNRFQLNDNSILHQNVYPLTVFKLHFLVYYRHAFLALDVQPDLA